MLQIVSVKMNIVITYEWIEPIELATRTATSTATPTESSSVLFEDASDSECEDEYSDYMIHN